MREIVHSPAQPQHGFNANRQAKNFLVLLKDSAVNTIPVDNITYPIYSNMVSSSGGEYLYYSISGKILRMDRSGNVVTLLDMAQITGRSIYPFNLSLSQDRYLCFTNLSSRTVDDIALWIYDMLEQKFTFSQTNPNIYERTLATEQTPDGKFLIVHHVYHTEVHTLSNGSVVSTREFKTSYDGVFVNTAGDNRIIFVNNPDEIILYDPVSGARENKTLDTRDLPPGTRYQYDRVTGYIGTEYRNYFYVVNPISGQVVRKILIRESANTIRLYNGHLYEENRKLDLKLI